MAPSATPSIPLPSPTLDTTSRLTKAGTNKTLTQTLSNGIHASPIADLSASHISITRTLDPRPIPAPNSPEVWSQKVHTDHMLTCTWSAESGWARPEIRPYGPLSIMPAASVLHYATECFEGMKVFRGFDGKLRIFRPERNAARMLKSATRIALPGFPPEEFQKLVEAFVAFECPRWLPDGENGERGSYLYLRPTMIGTTSAMGIQKPQDAMLFIVAFFFPPLDEPDKAPKPAPSSTTSSTGSTMATPKQHAGMRLLASSHDMIRAWPGGFGSAKVGANYGPSIIAQQEAKERGFTQILWLFGDECYVTEAGGSNFFVLWRTKQGNLQLITAPLGDGVILEGVTRQSVIDVVKEKLGDEVEVVERKFTMAELVDAHDEGRLVEAFGSGTAYFIAPVSDIHFRGRDLELPLSKGVEAKYATSIKKWLKDIMYGNVEHDWAVVVEEADAPSAEPSPTALDRANEWLRQN